MQVHITDLEHLVTKTVANCCKDHDEQCGKIWHTEECIKYGWTRGWLPRSSCRAATFLEDFKSNGPGFLKISSNGFRSS